MPRIPQYEKTHSLPGTSGGVAMSPDAASANARATIGFGQQVGQALGQFEDIYFKEKKAKDAIEAAKLETTLRDKEREISGRLHAEPDYNNYQKIVDDGATEIQGLLPKNAGRNLSLASQRAAEHSIGNLKDVAQKKTYTEMEIVGKNTFIDLKNNAKEDILNAETDEEREALSINLKMKAIALSENLVVDKLWLKGQTETFDKEVKSEGQVRGQTIAYEASLVDPVGTAKRLREDKNYLSYLEPDTRLKVQKQLDTDAKEFNNGQGASKEVVQLLRKAEIEFPNDPQQKYAKALEMAESADYQERLGNDIIHSRIITNLSNGYSQAQKMYDEKADDIKSKFIDDVIANKTTKNDLTDLNPEWKFLRSKDKVTVNNFALSKHRADVQFIREGRSLSLAEEHAKRIKQQENAVIFFGKTMTKITDGSYTDVNQIIKDFTVDNPIIQSKVNSYVSLFKSIESSPELKDGISTIKKAAASGLLDPDYNKNLFKQGTLMVELRNKYITEEDFRGEKVNTWLQQKIEPEVKNGIGVWLNNIFKSNTQKPMDIPIKNEFGLREDGSPKGNGFFGKQKMTDGSGKDATELSIGVSFNGEETEIPTLVPTLNKKEIDYLLNGGKPTETIIKKAVDHAKKRISKNKSPFAQQDESVQTGRDKNTGRRAIKYSDGTIEYAD